MKEELRDKVSKNYITTYDELELACKEHGLEVYEDILSPMEWNSCDRCGKLGCSDGDFLWTEGFEWDLENEVERRVADYIADKWDFGEYWSALCWECIDDIKARVSIVASLSPATKGK